MPWKWLTFFLEKSCRLEQSIMECGEFGYSFCSAAWLLLILRLFFHFSITLLLYYSRADLYFHYSSNFLFCASLIPSFLHISTKVFWVFLHEEQHLDIVLVYRFLLSPGGLSVIVLLEHNQADSTSFPPLCQVILHICLKHLTHSHQKWIKGCC